MLCMVLGYYIQLFYSKPSKNSQRMSSFTSLSSLSKSEPSLCIPWVFPNITDRRVAYVFNQLHLGEIERIDMVQRDNHQRKQLLFLLARQPLQS